jgi:hypothetical protein
LIISSNIYGQICDTASSWNYYGVFIPDCGAHCEGDTVYTNHHYFMQGDTIIVNTIYKVLYDQSDIYSLFGSRNKYKSKLGFLRDNNTHKKVYFLSIDDTSSKSEILLYDFTLKNDSIFKILYKSLKVIAIDSLNFIGGKRLVISFSDMVYNYLSNKEDTLKWIEGIGSYSDLTYYFTSPNNALLCYKSNGELKYINELGLNCTYLGPKVSVDNIKKFSLKVYPNPTDGQLNIENIRYIKRLEIYNILGAKVYSNCPNQLNLRIDNLNLKEGIYILNVDNENRKIIIK